jgi:hypothetical protein
VAHIQYIGKNGGQNADLEREKTEALRLSNEVQRTKLAKLNGDVVGRKEIQFTVGFALARLRENILRLPNLVSAELRGLDRAVVHGVRMRVDQRIRRVLEELGESLALAVSAPDFIDRMNGDAETDVAKAAAERKRSVANARRREKYAARRKD